MLQSYAYIALSCVVAQSTLSRVQVFTTLSRDELTLLYMTVYMCCMHVFVQVAKQ
jgi:hypothetical protein